MNPRSMAMALLLAAGALSACSAGCDPEENDLDMAAGLAHNGGGRTPLPHDAWTENPKLELFLRDALKAEGMRSLATKYGMQCVPSGCNDCLTCRKTKEQWIFGPSRMPLASFRCVDWGEVLIQVETGPGDSIRAMTYWRTTPDGREFLVKKAREHAQPSMIYVPPVR